MSMFKKAKYVGVVSSLFCVGSLMAGPVPGSGGGGAHPGGGASGSGKAAPSPSGAPGERIGGSEVGSRVNPAMGGMSGSSQTVRTETRTGPDGSRVTAFESASGGSAAANVDASGRLQALDLTVAGGLTFSAKSTGAPGVFELTDADGTALGRIDVKGDGRALFTGNLGGQDSATYDVKVDGDTTTFTDVANSSQTFTFQGNGDGTISVTTPNGATSQVAAFDTPSGNDMAASLEAQGAPRDVIQQVSTLRATVGAISAASAPYGI